MITYKTSGNLKKTMDFLQNAGKLNVTSILDKYGKIGVNALRDATPVDSGITASSWGYRITNTKGSLRLVWFNTETSGSTPIVILIQYGHATKNGGYVQGVDFINPALKPIFEKIESDIKQEVSKL